ncbi:MAG: RsbRD N-terminal domain-containing protein [Desulfobacterales bacterium]|nr:RsbRD N-terminal domain-containing protein [Desulfobacterales bacterium]
MRLNDLLEQKKAAIVKQWFNMVVNTYSLDTSQFLKNQKDPFANPVGNTISQGLEPLFNELTKQMDQNTIISFLEPILKIRAVQVMFSPSQAVSFIFSLKETIRKNLEKEICDNKVLNELMLFESKIDEMALMAFDIFMKCREKIYEIKATDERNRTFRAFERAGLVAESQEDRLCD